MYIFFIYMETLAQKLAKIEGFEWDHWNAAKNWEKHKVSKVEAEEVFFNRPVLFDVAKYPEREMRYTCLGRSRADRMLTIVFVFREKRIRVVSARAMSKKERERYAQVD